MIWCVEDDQSILDIELYALNATGFESRGFSDGLAFYNALNEVEVGDKQCPRLVVLDVMLPGLDGLELLKRIRSSAKFSKLPVVMATAKGSEYDKIKGLDLGADYYIAKPFSVMELVSCIKAVLRRCEASCDEHKILKAGEIELNTGTHNVTAGGKEVILTFKEFELLRFFMENPSIVFSRDRLFNEIWGLEYYGESRTVDMHIRTLRQKLGENGNIIKTVRNVGYGLSLSKEEVEFS